VRFLRIPLVGVFVLVMFAGPSGILPTPAAADDMGMTTCPSFTSTSWVNPMPPGNSGNRYSLTLTQHEMTCAQAESWAKKLIVQHIPGKPGMPQYPPLKGGPPGYVCTGSPDTTGHAWRGHCLKSTGKPFGPSFDWTDD